ncbi:MAG: hypothetical protein HYV60_16475, partial [Planctomycetia bacterium]|nr:hypothetical protein [Planctomycetia bacterium]
MDPGVAGFDLKAQIVTSKSGPRFQAIRFAGDLWNTFPHIESGGPLPFDRTLASGDVAFTQGFEARANGTLVTLMIDTTGIPAGSYEFRLVGTRLGSSSFRRADGSGVSEIIKNGTLQVRSIWQNPDNPNDVNGDGRISPLDALLLLNELSKRGSGELEMPSSGEEPSSFFDVNGDGSRSPNDALHIINCLNELGCETSPAPILAQVTPDFEPDLPDATGVSTPGQTTPKPKSEDEPSDEVDSSLPLPCTEDELDEDGNPIPGTDPESCEDSESVPVEPLVPVTAFPEPNPTT